MESQKDETKTQQKESDAILARHLQEEFDKLNEASAVRDMGCNDEVLNGEQSQRSLGNEVLKVSCPVCTFNNEIADLIPGKHYKCVQCYTQLHVPNAFPQEEKQPQIRECPSCHLQNIIPSKKTDAILCGACFQQLVESNSPADAHSTQETRSVQIRCGQCSAINLVDVAVNANVIRFECGGCTSTNEVVLP